MGLSGNLNRGAIDGGYARNSANAFNAIGDYSAAPEIFFKEAAINEFLFINRMVVHLNATGNLRSGGYGDNVAPLTNGIIVRKIIGGVVRNLSCDTNVMLNNDWGRFNYDIAEVAFSGGGESTLQSRWTFELHGAPVILSPGDRFEVVLNDNMGLYVTEHTFYLGWTFRSF